jgi:hypothetical protein
MVIFHSYVSLPEGKYKNHVCKVHTFYFSLSVFDQAFLWGMTKMYDQELSQRKVGMTKKSASDCQTYCCFVVGFWVKSTRIQGMYP